MKYLILFIFFIPLVTANIIINEVESNPNGTDSGNEWIELYNPESHIINMTGWYIQRADNSQNKTISIISEPNSYYRLNTEGITLKNTDLVLKLYDNQNNIIDLTPSLNDEENDDRCWAKNGINWNFQTCTPSQSNQILSNTSYTLTINELFPNPQGNDDDIMPKGEFVEIYNPNNFNIDLGGYYIKDNANHKLIISDTNTIDGTIIKKEAYLTVYSNGFSGLLNNEGFEIIKLYSNNDELLDEVSYGYSEEALTWSLTNNVWQLREPTPNEKNRINEPEYNSKLKIENIYLGNDNKAEFGDTLRVKVSVYKGNTSKTSVSLELEGLSKKTKFNVEEKFHNQTLTIPIIIDPNCDSKIKPENYNLILSGLDTEDEKEILVEGINTNICKEYKIEYLNFEVLTVPNEIKDKSNLEIKLINNDRKKHTFEVWSYIIKDRNIVSYDSHENKKIVEIPDKSSMIINLENIIEPDTEPGDYTLRIKVLKDTRKTAEKIDFNIKVDNDIHQNQTKNLINTKNLVPSIVYESSSKKAENTGIYIFSSLILLITIAIIIKNDNHKNTG